MNKERVEKVNRLVKYIAERTGYFRCKSNSTIGKFVLSPSEFYWLEEFTGEKIHIPYPVPMNEPELRARFNHGSTLTSQILWFAQYIYTGKYIVIDSENWGASYDDVFRVQTLAWCLGITANRTFRHHTYGKPDRVCWFGSHFVEVDSEEKIYRED